VARSKYPRFSASLALAQAMAAAGDERQRRTSAAVDSFAIDTATGWSVDLAAGTIRFTLPEQDLVGDAALVGVFSKIGKTWTWGWSVEGIAHVVAAVDGLDQPIVALTEAQADGLAQLAFVATDDAFLYRAFGPASDTYVSVGALRSEAREPE
jgi:hypothetical protein